MMIFSTISDYDDKLFMESLYTEYYKMLFYVASSYIFEDGTAEDVVHDAFVKLIPKVSLLQKLECCKLRAYLVSTVRNTAITKAGKLKTERESRIYIEEETVLDQIPSNTPSPEIALILKESKTEFSNILHSLPDSELFLLEAKYFFNMTDEEIAKNLQVKPASVRMMLTRVRRKVFNMMQEVTYING